MSAVAVARLDSHFGEDYYYPAVENVCHVR